MKIYKSFKVGREGVILGVFDEPEMVYMVSSGKVVGTDDYWTDGMSTWSKVSSRPTWTVSAAAVTPSAESPGRPRSPAFPSALPDAPPDKKSPEPVNPVSFFSVWWKTALAIYVGSALLGFLNSGEYGLGYALGGGIIVAPLSGLLFGGMIYVFIKK